MGRQVFMNYAVIKTHDIANGPGVRVSLFVSGCTHHCRGCFNPETWDFAYGKPFDAAVEEQLLSLLAPWYIRGLSLLGGEPMEPENQAALLPFLRRVKARYPEKTVWCYTGYLFDRDLLAGQVGDWSVTRPLLECIDVLVDGEFILAEKDPSLAFRGSANQRIIDVAASRAADDVVLWAPPRE